MNTLSVTPSSFSRSFTRIGTSDLRDFVDREYAKGRYWPEALLQINPNYPREGRVDRFGQVSPEVRCVLLYGHDNPVDGFILNVILESAPASPST